MIFVNIGKPPVWWSMTNDLTVAKIINFLRYARSDTEILAVQLINKELDEGMDLDEILKTREHGYGYSLDVQKVSGSRYRIDFGCLVGPLAGDGGIWAVRFGDDDTVLTCQRISSWNS